MIPVLFNILFAFIPLVFFKNTSELFEFNKIIVLYIFTTLIMAVWLYNSIINKKFIFRRTMMDVPLLGYLVILLISTLFSIDPRTSWLGYYSRFNGGLISQICYALLYWAFVSNMDRRCAIQSINYSLLSTAIASALAIGEHYGLFVTCGLMGLGWKESCWVQDVQLRVFSTLGQPNWLAALIVALIPFTWNAILNSKFQILNYLLSTLFFITLIFTGSRSGLLAFGIESIIFWIFALRKHGKEFLILNIIFLILFFVFKTPTPISNGPALETGGTESGVIRKYVWLGAINIFKHYPILGTGPETFAFSFPKFKPLEHNLTSEWDFIYNKAHNEYLNYLANTGVLGFTSYLVLIGMSIFQIITNKYKYPINTNIQSKQNSKLVIGDHLYLFDIGLFAGYISILVTNFFGFSVVPISLLFFLFPAIAIANNSEHRAFSHNSKLNLNQKIGIAFIVLTSLYSLFSIYSYWLSDIKNQGDTHPSPYNLNIIRSKANLYYKVENYNEAIKTIKSGIEIAPYDPKLYYEMAIYQIKNNNIEEGILSLKKAIELKPNYDKPKLILNKISEPKNDIIPI